MTRHVLHDTTVVFTDRTWSGQSTGPYASCNLGANTAEDTAVVHANRIAVARELGLDAVHCARQVHGTAALTVDRHDGFPAWSDADATTPTGDALFTTQQGVGIAVLVADCAPVAIAAPGVAAVVHAGWRGLVAGVIESAVDAIRPLSGEPAAAPLAILGPCIGPCCFEVGEEVAQRFDPAHVVRRAGAPRPFVDLRAAVVARLAAVGIACDVVDRCTSCDPDYYSHRRDAGTTGRQAVIAWR